MKRSLPLEEAAQVVASYADDKVKVVVPGRQTVGDISQEMGRVVRKHYFDAIPLAYELQGKNHFQTCQNIHSWIRENVAFVEDERSYQAIQTPAQLVKSKAGDCKSFAVLAGSMLHGLGKKWHFRFSGNGKIHHVYVISEGVAIDPTLKELGEPSNHNKKTDMLVTISGPGAAYDNFIEIEPWTTTDEELEAQILAEREALISDILEQGEPIGFIFNKAKRAKRKAQREERKRQKNTSGAAPSPSESSGGFGTRVKQVLTAPGRAVAKLILQVILPRVAPFFLYIFIDERAANSMPPGEGAKRVKAKRLAKTIIDKTGVSESNFMGLIRNGIIKAYRKSPEQVIIEAQGGAGVGALPAILASAIPFLKDLIGKLISKLGANREDVSFSEFDGPDLSKLSQKKAFNQQFEKAVQTKINTGIVRPSDVSPLLKNVEKTPAQSGGGTNWGKVALYGGGGLALALGIYKATQSSNSKSKR